MGCTPPWPAPHVPSCPTVQVRCEFGIPRSSAAFLLDRQPRQPAQVDLRTKKKTRAKIVIYLTNADRDWQVLQVLVKGDHEPWINRWHEVVQHPVVLVQHDLWVKS